MGWKLTSGGGGSDPGKMVGGERYSSWEGQLAYSYGTENWIILSSN